jgi:hypothetical protein
MGRPLFRIFRKKRPVQKGVQAIFSGGSQRRGRIPARFSSYEIEDEIGPHRGPREKVASRCRNLEKKGENVSRFRMRNVLVAVMLVGMMWTTVVGVSDVSSGSPYHRDGATKGNDRTSSVRSFRTITPSFYAVSDFAEAIVLGSQSYTGTMETGVDDFLIVQIAYSEGSGGNLPDISSVRDTQSNTYARVASAFPGVGSNFWEQVWTGRASSTTSSTSMTVSPDWTGCPAPCVTSIIIALTVGRYRGVAGIGGATAIAPSFSSPSQSANIAVTSANSTLVELLSHGASRNCGIDAPRPDTGQTARNCFTATTERTEFFDHSVSDAQTYTESYTWAQPEIQRGIYLELQGNLP